MRIISTYRIVSTSAVLFLASFHLTHALSGYSCFYAYLKLSKKKDEESCRYWGSPADDEEHTLFVCGKWGGERTLVCWAVGSEVTHESMVLLMLQPEKSWKYIESFITEVMRTKDFDRRKE